MTLETAFRLCGPLAALAIVASPVHAAVDRTVERTFKVPANVHVAASTAGGDVDVAAGADDTVTVVAHEHVKASSDAEADEVLSHLDLRIEQAGDEIIAKAEYGGHWHFGVWNWPPVQVSFKIRAPRGSSLVLKTSGGDVTVDGIAGEIHASTSGGDVKAGRVGGPVHASTSGGNIQVDEAAGPLHASTSGGSISVGKLGGAADLRTSGGDIKVDAAQSSVVAETSGGNVRVGFSGPILADSLLETSGGDVRATVSVGSNFHLDAHTSGGSVSCTGLALKIEHSSSGSLVGDAGTGGSTLRLKTSGGDVEVLTSRG